ncbi:Syntaxin-71 [Tetrabaena socialis]|uniref:Syntaxin-71 n=1 Tax=Tetrabaena socialis TaxID=47790 RepID=A0A2J8A5A3_9CHLO|nr:Syntaxin-71 [Tetrabaena socialis]|eukprot:PNH07677.1 Syntaxin-71 [Tetrabaena socialis]
MSIYDLIQRTNTILKKYEKYDAPIKTRGAKTDDPFQEELQEVEAELEKLLEAASDVALEQNRALIAAKNAEIRRAKNVLLTDALQSLEKKVKKGKGVNKQIIADRQGQIKDLIERIYAVPDGMSMAANRRPARTYAKGKKGDAVYLNGEFESNAANQDGYYSHTEGTQKFEKEWEEAKKAQDKRLERIEQGVVELGDMARNIGERPWRRWTDNLPSSPPRPRHPTNISHPPPCSSPGEEVDRQAPVIDDIEQQMDKVTSSLKTNNAKLKAMVGKMRSSRNFCVDIILVSILLAIGAYIYAMFM